MGSFSQFLRCIVLPGVVTGAGSLLLALWPAALSPPSNLHHLRTALAMPPDVDLAERLEYDPCMDEGLAATLVADHCRELRRVWVDYDGLDIPGRHGAEVIRYDFHEVTRPVTLGDLPYESELSVAVRLLLSEIGADRLLTSRNAIEEAIGILYTVDNRLDLTCSNPEMRPDAPYFPGCGPGADFATCAEPGEYLGLLTKRALDPLARFPLDELEPATDLAVYAWYLQERGYSPDPTFGATSYVHRCGGAAYGEPTYRCDGHLGWGRRGNDVPGANPFTGPIAFKAPERYLERKGWYVLHETSTVDYSPWEGLAPDMLPSGDAWAEVIELEVASNAVAEMEGVEDSSSASDPGGEAASVW